MAADDGNLAALIRTVLIDLPDLGGAELLRAEGIEVETLVRFSGH